MVQAQVWQFSGGATSQMIHAKFLCSAIDIPYPYRILKHV